MGVELLPSTLSILLASAAFDSLISCNMAIIASLLLWEVDGPVMLVKLLTVSFSV